jgi:hypothetical protein
VYPDERLSAVILGQAGAAIQYLGCLNVGRLHPDLDGIPLSLFRVILLAGRHSDFIPPAE